MIRETWSYDGERGLMTLCDFYGDPVLTLPLTIPEAHALANFIGNRDREVAEASVSRFLEQITKLAGKQV